MRGKPFPKGQPSNPSGRPKVVSAAECRELARKHAPAALKALASIMNDVKAPSSARKAAAKALRDHMPRAINN